jgi:hypothetical protein
MDTLDLRVFEVLPIRRAAIADEIYRIIEIVEVAVHSILIEPIASPICVDLDIPAILLLHAKLPDPWSDRPRDGIPWADKDLVAFE